MEDSVPSNQLLLEIINVDSTIESPDLTISFDAIILGTKNILLPPQPKVCYNKTTRKCVRVV